MQAVFGVAVLMVGALAATGAHFHAVNRIGAVSDRRRRRDALALPWFLAVVAILNASALGTTFGTRMEMNEGAEVPGEPVGGDFALFLLWLSVAVVWPFVRTGRAVTRLERVTGEQLHRIHRGVYLRITAAYLISGAAVFPLGDLATVQVVIDILFGSWAPAHTALLLGLELSVLVVAVLVVRLVHRIRAGTWSVPRTDSGEGPPPPA